MQGEVEELFHEVADLSAETRARYLDEREVNGTTRLELEQLLAFDSATSGSLERDIGHVANRAISEFQAAGSATGTLCGSYRLGKLLGRGGMGSVYLAERVDGEITQLAAVKLIDSASGDPRLRQHFLAERQILAGLSHPNIARLLDAGHREDGQPYLVMEYIEGVPLDAYTAGLSIRRRITVFLRICRAVGYLHRNLIVHRDLKPGNILVTADGQPKILDFGIAKILDLSTDSAVTSLRILTPEYASPEQFAGRTVSTLSDVYSLGAVLYRVLTEESPRPAGCNSNEETASLSSSRFAQASSIAPDLRGDLEFILMKALRPEPHERYETVEQFAEDLENYLEHRPIRARKGDTWYRARKFLRRYRVLVAAAAAVIFSLTAGLYVANRERLIAERRFGQLRQLSTRIIDLDRAIRTLPGSIDARERLVAASLEYLEGLSREARSNRDLAMEVADGYWRLGRIQGVNAELNLGHSAKAEESLSKADSLIRSVLASRPGSRNAQFRFALIAHDRLIVADTAKRHADALAHAREAVERLEAFLRLNDSADSVKLAGFLRPGPAADSEKAGVALLYSNIALGYVNMHRYADGAACARRAVEAVKGISSAADIQGQSLSVLANALRYQGDLEGALRTIRQARAIGEKAISPSETARFFSRYGLLHREGLILGEAGAVNLERPDEAITLLGQALDLAEAAAARDPRDSASRGRVGTTAGELGEILVQRDPRRSLAVFDTGLRRLAEAGGRDNGLAERAVLLAKSSYALRRLGRLAEAKTRIEEALAILKTTGYPSQQVRLGSDPWIVLSALADYTAQAGNPRRALEIRRQLLTAVMATNPEVFSDLRDVPKLAGMYEAAQELALRTGDHAEAENMKAQRIELWSHWQRELPQNAFVRKQLEAAQRSGRA